MATARKTATRAVEELLVAIGEANIRRAEVETAEQRRALAKAGNAPAASAAKGGEQVERPPAPLQPPTACPG